MKIKGKNLQKGKTGSEVAHLQKMLKNLGLGEEIDPTEWQEDLFGQSTEEALIEFQKTQALKPTGEVDDDTAEAITQIFEYTSIFKYSFSGKVVNEQNNAAAGLRVEAWTHLQAGPVLVRTTKTDAQGGFKFQFTLREIFHYQLYKKPGLFFRVFQESRMLYDSQQFEQYWSLRQREEPHFQVDLRKEELDLEQLQEENRITRLCLIGSGIVCGLDICVDEDHGIHLSRGNAITSNGRYVEIPQGKQFRYYTPFTPDDYPLFQNAEAIWQLEEEPQGESLKPQSSEEKRNPFLKDKVLLIYLKPGNTSEMIYQPRFLLMNQSDVLDALDPSKMATRVLWANQKDDEDYIYSDEYNPEDNRPRIHTLHLTMNPALRLPELFLQRLGFSEGDPFNCPPEGVDTSVFPIIKNLDDLFDAYEPVIDKATKELDDALTKMIATFGTLLECRKTEKIRAWIELLCLKWEAYKRENREGEVSSKHYIQYFYGWVRDLIQGYNELRNDLIDLVSDCCPNPNEFPRHLFLGIVLRPDLARLPQPLRHTFRPTYISNGHTARLERLRLYCWRELMMIKTFYLPQYIVDPEINPYAEVDARNLPDYSSVKITPGRFYDQPLGEQTIPFYYPINWSRYSVHHFWNYQRAKNCATDQLLSYHASDADDSYTMRFHVIRSLHYKLDCYPFFRIEGHIGKPLNDVFTYQEVTAGDGTPQYELTFFSGVVARLVHLKEKYNLPIYFRGISVENLVDLLVSKDGEDFAYKFPDLERRYENLPNTAPEYFNSFRYKLLGLEHLAGIKEGGTFLVVYQNQPLKLTGPEGRKVEKTAKIAIADFFLPCCSADDNFSDLNEVLSANEGQEAPENDKDDDNTQEIEESAVKASLLSALGMAAKQEKDDLQEIKGIGPKYEKQLNDLGIYTYLQLSKITEREYRLIDGLNEGLGAKGERDKWADQAKDLIEKSK